jgi:hypothetical protein
MIRIAITPAAYAAIAATLPSNSALNLAATIGALGVGKRSTGARRGKLQLRFAPRN